MGADVVGATGEVGMILSVYEQFEAAATCYERAPKLAPEPFKWLYYLRNAQQSLGRHREAAESLGEALRRNPHDLPSQLLLAQVLQTLTEVEKSRQLYESDVADNP